jgi:CPA1 family monovalent cation:H+ antiporter
MSIHEIVAGTMMLMLIAVAIRVISKRLNLPFTVLLVIAGIMLSEVAEYAPPILHNFASPQLSADVFLLIFLPTLIFESAFNLDSRQLRQNLLPVLFLAVPGVLLSTAIIGGLLHWLAGLDIFTALILGALLSATDPVAVIALFKQLGAPKRLTVLVEGESLFNDATAIVLTRIIIVVALAGTVTAGDIAAGVLQFILVFIGGLLVGAIAAVLVGWLLGRVESDPFIEVPLTVILAYAAFLIAEEIHLSGVMAVVAAGIVMGGWGRTKISPAISHYLSELWEYFAFIANALIFLLVGLMVKLEALWATLDLLAWVVLAMLISRLFVVYGLVPVANKLPGAQAVNLPYRHVMYWGGLRGAIALALVLSLPESFDQDMFIALTAGAVLFTLVVQGLSIGPLVHWLKLDDPPLGDRLAAVGGALDAVRKARAEIPKLRSGGLFSQRIAEVLEHEYQAKEHDWIQRREVLAATKLTSEQERSLLFLHGFVTEKRIYYDMFSKGHLAEGDYRDLCHSLDLQIDYIRMFGELPRYTLHSLLSQRFQRALLHFLERFFSVTGLPQYFSNRYTARDYSKTWSQFRGSSQILALLPELARLEGFSEATLQHVTATYERWQNSARKRLDSTAEQFPEFVSVMQERRARRLLLLKQRKIIAEHIHHAQITEGLGGEQLAEIDRQLRNLRGYATDALRIEPEELLTKVAFFQHMSRADFEHIKRFLHPITIPPNEYIIHQGDKGASMFFIARGVIRVLRQDGAETRELGTLMGGDFFGEKSLLNNEARSATCRAVTACALYELRREDFDTLITRYPDIQREFDRANSARHH